MEQALFDRIIRFLLPDMDNADDRKALVETALYGSPVLKLIDWTGPANTFTVRLVGTLDRFGDAETGLPATYVLLENLKPHVGEDRKEQINELLQDILDTPHAEEQQKSFWYRLFHPQRPDNRKNLIANVRKAWIEGVLEKALVDDRLLTLVGKAELQAVEPPRIERIVQRPQKQDYNLTSSADIERFYQELGRELLILGAPGSGKTITLLELGQRLLEQADRDPTAPIPVVFNLSSWAVKRVPLEEWLVERLYLDYSVPKKLANKWLADGRLTFLLDGLDEVQGAISNDPVQEEQSQTQYREECIQAINLFWRRYNLGSNGMVICSRVADYQALDTKLQFENAHTAILLQPLDPKEAHSYLFRLGKDWKGLQQAFDQDDNIQALSASPLLLNILAVAYQDLPANQITGFANKEKQSSHLFHNYINRCLLSTSDNRDLPQQQVRDYLSWLARKMVTKGQTIFYIENLGHSWLDTHIQKKQYQLSVVLIPGVVGCLVLGWGGNPVVGLLGGLVVGRGGSLIGGLVGDKGKIQFVEVIRFSRVRLFIGQFVGLLIGLFIGQFVGLLIGLFIGQFVGLVGWLVTGLIGGLVGETSEVKLKTVPNQAVWLSARNAIISGVGVGLVFGLLSGLGGLLSGLGGLLGGLGVGLVGGGGMAVIAHAVLRLILFRSHVIPWNCAKFLDDAADHHLLRKVGGGYIFRHRMLMDYFASLKDI